MQIVLMVSAVGVGLVLGLHLAMNASVGNIVSNPQMGNALFWVIGATIAVAIGFTKWDTTFFSRAREVPGWLWAAGAMGACLVFVIAALIPKLGAGTTNILLLTGQVSAGLLIAHFGLLSSPVERLTAIRVVGAVIMIAGAALAVLGRVPFLR